MKYEVDKEDLEILKAYTDQMPVIMNQTHEVHRMTGEELIEMGYAERDGEKINPKKTYLYNAPVLMAANHYRRLKRAWLRDGEAGIKAYLIEVAKALKMYEPEPEKAVHKKKVPVT